MAATPEYGKNPSKIFSGTSHRFPRNPYSRIPHASGLRVKTAITLALPTVGRQSADLSADKMPDFSSFFIGRQKINYNYLVIIFSIGRQFWGFGNRPMIGRRSADDRPISWPMSYLNEPHIIGRCVGRPSADDRPIVAHHLSSADVSADDRPIVKFWV